MLTSTHQKIARKIAEKLKLSENEAMHLERGSVIPDRWKDFPHNSGKESEIATRIIEARKLFLLGQKIMSLYSLGVALHYIQDNWVSVPGSDPEHIQWEKKRLKIPGDDKQLIAQINEQQYEYLKPKTAQERIHLKFWHPRDRHDDQLYALALACYASTEAPPPGKGAIMLPHQ